MCPSAAALSPCSYLRDPLRQGEGEAAQAANRLGCSACRSMLIGGDSKVRLVYQLAPSPFSVQSLGGYFEGAKCIMAKEKESHVGSCRISGNANRNMQSYIHMTVHMATFLFVAFIFICSDHSCFYI